MTQQFILLKCDYCGKYISILDWLRDRFETRLNPKAKNFDQFFDYHLDCIKKVE